MRDIPAYSGFQLSEKTYRFPEAGLRPQAVPGVIVFAGNAPFIPSYLLSLLIQVQTAVFCWKSEAQSEGEILQWCGLDIESGVLSYRSVTTMPGRINLTHPSVWPASKG